MQAGLVTSSRLFANHINTGKNYAHFFELQTNEYKFIIAFCVSFHPHRFHFLPDCRKIIFWRNWQCIGNRPSVNCRSVNFADFRNNQTYCGSFVIRDCFRMTLRFFLSFRLKDWCSHPCHPRFDNHFSCFSGKPTICFWLRMVHLTELCERFRSKNFLLASRKSLRIADNQNSFSRASSMK